ncbi:MAG: hypothetical protein WA905_08665, partial [Pseudolabrys sp.]
MLFENFKMEMAMKKASTRFVLLVLGAASLSAALTLPVSAQTKPSTSQNCGNASTARDKQLKPDARCLMTSEQYLEEKAKMQVPVARELAPGEVWVPLGLTGPHINYNDIKKGNGGSGGSRG